MAESWYRLPRGAMPWRPGDDRSREHAARPAASAFQRSGAPVEASSSPSRIVLALSPGAVTEPPLQAALALAERFAVSLHIVRLGSERAEQIARLPFTREFSTTVCAFRRFEPADARLGHLGQSRRVELMVTRLQTERASVAVRFEQGSVPDDPGAWVLRDSAPWMPTLRSGGAYDQIIVLTDGDRTPIEAAAMLPRRRSTRVRVLLPESSGDPYDASILARLARSLGATGLERIETAAAGAGRSTSGADVTTAPPAGRSVGGSDSPRGARTQSATETRIVDACGVLNSVLVVRSALLARLGLPAGRLSSRVGLAVLELP